MKTGLQSIVAVATNNPGNPACTINQYTNALFECVSVFFTAAQLHILKMSHSSITGLLAHFFWLEGKLVRPRHPLLALLNFSNNVFAVFGNLDHKSFLMI